MDFSISGCATARSENRPRRWKSKCSLSRLAASPKSGSWFPVASVCELLNLVKMKFAFQYVFMFSSVWASLDKSQKKLLVYHLSSSWNPYIFIYLPFSFIFHLSPPCCSFAFAMFPRAQRPEQVALLSIAIVLKLRPRMAATKITTWDENHVEHRGTTSESYEHSWTFRNG